MTPPDDAPIAALEAWIRDMPAGQWVPEGWAQGPLVRVETLDHGYDRHSALIWKLVVDAYDIDDDGIMEVPELVAHILEWYGGEDAGFTVERI